MYPADFGQFYRNLPVRLTTGGTVYVEARRYVSRLEAGPHKECGAFLRAARKWTATNHSSHFPEARSWLYGNVGRIVGCFAGKGLPEEISLICGLALASGFKTVGSLPAWAWKCFGQDCCGFTSNYFVALGTFGKAVYDIPSYKSIGGVATQRSHIDYDNAILFADLVGGVPKIRKNPGNKSHIMLVECWLDYGDTIYVAQAASSKGGVDYDRVYRIVEEPKSQDWSRAYWRLRNAEGGGIITAVITKRMASWATGED